MVKRVSRVMKDSGDERIAFIPNEWGLIKLKYIVDCNKDVLRETTDHNYSFRYVDIGSVSLEKGIEKYERVSFGDSPSRARRIVHKGDVIVSTVRTYLKAIANIDDADNVIVSTGFAVLSPRIVDPLFLEYACKSHYFTENVTIESTGISYPAINSTKLLQLKIAVPSKEEQVIIGQILHDRIKEIDRVIEQTKLTIEDYKLLKQSIITEAVTKGLDENVEMIESGNKWIGEIPENWNYTSLKNVLSTPITDGPHETPQLYDKGIPFVSAEAIKKEKIDFAKIRGFISLQDHIKFSKKIKPVKNDIFMVKSGATTGNIGIVETDEEFSIWSPLALIRANHEIISFKYLFYYLQSKNFRIQVEQFWNYGTQQNIGMKVLGSLQVIVPDLLMQQSIADYLDDTIHQINHLIDKKEGLLNELEEYKKSIIFEYVTGKKEVE